MRAVREFNRRLAARGGRWRFPESPVPDWLPPGAGATVWQEFYLVVQDSVVHGGFILKRQEAAVRGQRLRVASFYWPLSEAVVDPAYALIPVRMLRAAMEREHLLFSVGMGGADMPIARLLRAFRWPLTPVPLYFKALAPDRFLRQLRYLRKRPAVARLLDVAVATGAGPVGLRALQAAAWRRDRSVRAEPVASFGDWSDAVWAASAPAYAFVGVRDAAALNATYPPRSGDGRVRLRVRRGADTIGWAVVHDGQHAANEHFGDMRVGTIMDGFARPEDAAAVVQAGVDALAERGVDVVISNQSHYAWRRALRAAGCLRGPTSWLYSLSPALAAVITRADATGRELHLNRGDGDEPWGVSIAETPVADSAARSERRSLEPVAG